ncbi:IS91 family transposase, partial [Escherichia coli O111:NM]
TDFGGKTSIFSHPVYLFLREFSLQDFRGGSLCHCLIRLFRLLGRLEK